MPFPLPPAAIIEDVLRVVDAEPDTEPYPFPSEVAGRIMAAFGAALRSAPKVDGELVLWFNGTSLEWKIVHWIHPMP